MAGSLPAEEKESEPPAKRICLPGGLAEPANESMSNSSLEKSVGSVSHASCDSKSSDCGGSNDEERAGQDELKQLMNRYRSLSSSRNKLAFQVNQAKLLLSSEQCQSLVLMREGKDVAAQQALAPAPASSASSTAAGSASTTTAATAANRRHSVATQPADKVIVIDDDLMIIEKAPPVSAAAVTSARSSTDSDVVIVCDDDSPPVSVAAVAAAPPSPAPHPREKCSTYHFRKMQSSSLGPVSSNANHCAYCECYACGKPAAQCAWWKAASSAHCNAHSQSQEWKKTRRRAGLDELASVVIKTPIDLDEINALLPKDDHPALRDTFNAAKELVEKIRSGVQKYYRSSDEVRRSRSRHYIHGVEPWDMFADYGTGNRQKCCCDCHDSCEFCRYNYWPGECEFEDEHAPDGCEDCRDDHLCRPHHSLKYVMKVAQDTNSTIVVALETKQFKKALYLLTVFMACFFHPSLWSLERDKNEFWDPPRSVLPSLLSRLHAKLGYSMAMALPPRTGRYKDLWQRLKKSSDAATEKSPANCTHKQLLNDLFSLVGENDEPLKSLLTLPEKRLKQNFMSESYSLAKARIEKFKGEKRYDACVRYARYVEVKGSQSSDSQIRDLLCEYLLCEYGVDGVMEQFRKRMKDRPRIMCFRDDPTRNKETCLLIETAPLSTVLLVFEKLQCIASECKSESASSTSYYMHSYSHWNKTKYCDSDEEDYGKNDKNKKNQSTANSSSTSQSPSGNHRRTRSNSLAVRMGSTSAPVLQPAATSTALAGADWFASLSPERLKRMKSRSITACLISFFVPLFARTSSTFDAIGPFFTHQMKYFVRGAIERPDDITENIYMDQASEFVKASQSQLLDFPTLLPWQSYKLFMIYLYIELSVRMIGSRCLISPDHLKDNPWVSHCFIERLGFYMDCRRATGTVASSSTKKSPLPNFVEDIKKDTSDAFHNLVVAAVETFKTGSPLSLMSIASWGSLLLAIRLDRIRWLLIQLLLLAEQKITTPHGFVGSGYKSAVMPDKIELSTTDRGRAQQLLVLAWFHRMTINTLDGIRHSRYCTTDSRLFVVNRVAKVLTLACHLKQTAWVKHWIFTCLKSSCLDLQSYLKLTETLKACSPGTAAEFVSSVRNHYGSLASGGDTMFGQVGLAIYLSSPAQVETILHKKSISADGSISSITEGLKALVTDNPSQAKAMVWAVRDWLCMQVFGSRFDEKAPSTKMVTRNSFATRHVYDAKPKLVIVDVLKLLTPINPALLVQAADKKLSELETLYYEDRVNENERKFFAIVLAYVRVVFDSAGHLGFFAHRLQELLRSRLRKKIQLIQEVNRSKDVSADLPKPVASCALLKEVLKKPSVAQQPTTTAAAASYSKAQSKNQKAIVEKLSLDRTSTEHVHFLQKSSPQVPILLLLDSRLPRRPLNQYSAPSAVQCRLEKEAEAALTAASTPCPMDTSASSASPLKQSRAAVPATSNSSTPTTARTLSATPKAGGACSATQARISSVPLTGSKPSTATANYKRPATTPLENVSKKPMVAAAAASTPVSSANKKASVATAVLTPAAKKTPTAVAKTKPSSRTMRWVDCSTPTTPAAARRSIAA
eukprot:scpid14598/ scgid3963/ 